MYLFRAECQKKNGKVTVLKDKYDCLTIDTYFKANVTNTVLTKPHCFVSEVGEFGFAIEVETHWNLGHFFVFIFENELNALIFT